MTYFCKRCRRPQEDYLHRIEIKTDGAKVKSEVCHDCDAELMCWLYNYKPEGMDQ